MNLNGKCQFIGALRRRAGWKLPLIVLLNIVVLGLVDDMPQPLVDRQATVGDLAADVAGIVVVTALWLRTRLCHPGIPRWWPQVQLAGGSLEQR